MPAHSIPVPLPWPSPPSPVAATGNITTVNGAGLIDGETFTVSDGVHPATVFEFDSDSVVTPGNVAVPFTGGDTLATVKAAILAAINGVGASLEVTASSGGAGQVLLANDAAGSHGNVAITDTVANVGFIPVGMTGGTPSQLTLTSYDLLWLSQGGTINDAATATQIRMEPATCRPGAYVRSYQSGVLPADLTATAKNLNVKIVSVNGFPAGGSLPSATDLSDEVQAAMDAEIALARQGTGL